MEMDVILAILVFFLKTNTNLKILLFKLLDEGQVSI